MAPLAETLSYVIRAIKENKNFLSRGTRGARGTKGTREARRTRLTRGLTGLTGVKWLRGVTGLIWLLTILIYCHMGMGYIALWVFEQNVG